MSSTKVTFSNGVEIELVSDKKEFLGIGAVSINGVAVRSNKRPMFVEIRNPYGVLLSNYTIKSQKVTAKGLQLEFAVDAHQSGNMEWMLHTVRTRYNALDWTKKPTLATDTTVSMIITPTIRTIDNKKFVGFTYQYKYSSKSIPIYKILDRGTWEIDKKATGNEPWLRTSLEQPIAPLGKDNRYSSEWYLRPAENPNIFQFQCLQTATQGFSFTAHDKGILMTWPTKVAHVRYLFERANDNDLLVHWLEHCDDLSHTFASTPMEVLFWVGKSDRVERANVYESVRSMVSAHLHRQIGMAEERITSYGIMEEWGQPDFVKYTKNGLSKLLGAGIKTIFVPSQFENNMNTWGVSNMCCQIDLKIAESVGPSKFKTFCQAIIKAGGRVQMWGNTSISTLTQIFDKRNGNSKRIKFLPKEGSIMDVLKKAHSPFVRNPSNAIDADHYTPVFALLNLRDPVVREYWLKSWKAAAEEFGVGGMFLDSSCNLSSDKFHFEANSQWNIHGATPDQSDLQGNHRPAKEPPAAILSQYKAHLTLMAEMQKFGYQYSGEDNGLFGIRRTGPGLDRRINNLYMWPDCYVPFDVPTINKFKADADDIYFRGLAYRVMWIIYWHPQTDKLSFCYDGIRNGADAPTKKHFALLNAFDVVNEYMHNRHILEDEHGVTYHANGKRVLWACTDMLFELKTATTVLDVVADVKIKTKVIKALKHHVYLIDEKV